jgi:hypothetical protein
VRGSGEARGVRESSVDHSEFAKLYFIGEALQGESGGRGIEEVGGEAGEVLRDVSAHAVDGFVKFTTHL